MLSLAASLALFTFAQDSSSTDFPVGVPAVSGRPVQAAGLLRGVVRLPVDVNGVVQANPSTFAKLEVTARFWPSMGAESRTPVRILGLRVGAGGALEIPWTGSFSQLEVTVESDGFAGFVKLRPKDMGDGPFEVPLHSGFPTVFRLVPPADSHYDPAKLVGEQLPVRYFQHEGVRRPVLDERMVRVEEGLLVRVRGFNFGANPEDPLFRRTRLTGRLLPHAIDRAWRPGALPADGIIDVPLVDTCTAVIHVTDEAGMPVDGARVQALGGHEFRWSGRTHRPGDAPGVHRIMGLSGGDFELVVEAKGLSLSTTLHRGRRGEVPIEIELAPLAHLTVELAGPLDAGALRLIRLDDPRGTPQAPLERGQLSVRFPLVESGLHAFAWGDVVPIGGGGSEQFTALGVLIVDAPVGGGTVRVDPFPQEGAELRLLPNARRGFSARTVVVPRWDVPSTPSEPAPAGTGPVRFSPVVLDLGPLASSPTQFVLAEVTAEGGARAPWRLQFDGVMDAEGSVQVESVPPIQHLAHFTSPKRGVGALVAIEGAAEQPTDLGRVELAPPRKVAIHSVDIPGDVTLQYGLGVSLGQSLALSMPSSVMGRRSVALPFNTDWLRASWIHPGTGRFESETIPLDTVQGDASEGLEIVELRRSKGGPMKSISVVDTDGLPLSLGIVEFRWLDGSRRSALVDRLGRAQIPHRANGIAPVEVAVFGAAEPGCLGPRDAGPIGSFAVDGDGLNFVVPSAEVHGRVIAHLSGSRFSQKCVALLPWPVPPDLDLFGVATGSLRSDGSFVLRHVPAGRHVVALLHAESAMGRFPQIGRRSERFVTATSVPFKVEEGQAMPRIGLHEGLGVSLPRSLLRAR